MFTINIKRLLYYLVPTVKRYLPSGELMLRVRWWQYLFAPLMAVMRNYDERRKSDILRANVTTELVVFQYYLRKVTGDLLLVIEPASMPGEFMSLSTSEVTTAVFIGNEPVNGMYIGTQGVGAWQVRYVTANPLLIKKELKTYLPAGLTCEVVAA